MAEAGDENRLPPALGGFLAQQIELICEQLDEYCLLDADNHLSLGREHLIQAITIAAAAPVKSSVEPKAGVPALPAHLRKATSSLEGHTRSLELPFSPMAMHVRAVRRTSIIELKEEKASNEKMLAKLAPTHTLRRETTLSVINSNSRSGTQTFDSPAKTGKRTILRSQPSASKLAKQQNLNLPPVGVSQTGEIEVLKENGRTASGAIQSERQAKKLAEERAAGTVVINPNSTLYWVSLSTLSV
jgi:hypothetical protein